MPQAEDAEASGFLSRVLIGQNWPGPHLCVQEGLPDPGQDLLMYQLHWGREGCGGVAEDFLEEGAIKSAKD